MRKAVAITVSALLVLVGTLAIKPVASAKDNNIRLKTFAHYPKEPGRPTPVSNCTPTANDQVNDWSTAGWIMPATGMEYKINYSTKPKGLDETTLSAAISDAFAAWNAADSKQIFLQSGTTSAKSAKYDGTNAILWKRIQSSAIAITYVWYYPTSGQLVEADTVFNNSYKWSVTSPSTGDCAGIDGTYDIRNIGTHEFGHWVGLDDLYSPVDKDLTMYGYGETKELKKDTLGLGDVTGVQAIAP